ncbi:retron St85 family RNA-directed DNA polymerase [Methylomonas sp. EFPC3]|uniref:retron St85 family RNA-directed DNA polymerase n=1 Tax=Methylomonas sp. EFPC3 TaxID=3021710 RepID=UPI0024178E98|nr:retron St85 family RNA-directed DNA polymerase [Methylomonas sp. EFPC3]WFP51447.1 retron St85 family RNA-directed DNA polymerase [Methylomonas sp. EFPC3]
MSKPEIIKFCLTSPHRYKTYKIPKRNSDQKRTISHPSKELKFIQRVLNDYLREKLPIHDCAYAYKHGLNIKDNAEVHASTKYFLKMDFEDFFPSITPDFFFTMLDKAGLEINEIDSILLKNFIFCKASRKSGLFLSIGAPSSPLISNFVLFGFDKNIKRFCAEKNINYTRYADDLTFSSNIKNSLFEIPEIVKYYLDIETNGKIKINKRKTVFSSKAHNRHVTGVTLTNDEKLSVGRDRKRLISAMIHHFKCEKLDPTEIEKLKGLMSFVNYIEGDFYRRMIIKYGSETIDKLNNYKQVKRDAK